MIAEFNQERRLLSYNVPKSRDLEGGLRNLADYYTDSGFGFGLSASCNTAHGNPNHLYINVTSQEIVNAETNPEVTFRDPPPNGGIEAGSPYSNNWGSPLKVKLTMYPAAGQKVNVWCDLGAGITLSVPMFGRIAATFYAPGGSKFDVQRPVNESLAMRTEVRGGFQIEGHNHFKHELTFTTIMGREFVPVVPFVSRVRVKTINGSSSTLVMRTMMYGDILVQVDDNQHIPLAPSTFQLFSDGEPFICQQLVEM